MISLRFVLDSSTIVRVTVNQWGIFRVPFFPWLMQHGWRRELFFLFSRHGRLIKNTISKGFNLLLLPSFFSSLCKICISIKILCETTHIYYVKDKYFGIFFFYYISFLRPSESLRTRPIPRIRLSIRFP